MSFKNIYIFIVAVFLTLSSNAQQQLIHIDSYSKEKTENEINKQNIQIHSSFKPLIKSQFISKTNIDSVLFEYGRDSAFLSKRKHPVWWQKLRTEDLLIVDKGDFKLRINPLFNFSMGKNTMNDTSLSINSRGILIEGDITDKFSFVTEFHENQAFFPDYFRDYAKAHRVVPGQGRLRNFEEWGFDYANASGSVSFTPIKQLNFTLGHGKHFIGDGYRSLLLSDNSFYYPYFKVSTTIKKFQYTYMLTSFQAASTADTRTLVYQRKHGSFLFLNYLLTKRIQIGLFEGIMFQTSDSTSNNNFTANYFNPFILTRSLGYGLSDNNNILLGLTAKIDLPKGIQTYGQFMLDDDVAKKSGWQVGLKAFNLFGLKNLYFQGEYNRVRPYSYAHSNINQSWTYYNQPISNPLGAGFEETILILKYRIKDFIIRVKNNYVVTSENYYIGPATGSYSPNTNVGVNVFQSDDNATYQPLSSSEIGKDNKITIRNINIGLSYLVNPVTNFQIFIEYQNRKHTNYGETNFYYFGIRTNLNNVYFDF